MADRREPPQPGSPEYNWLYGDPGAAPTPASPRPGETRRPAPADPEATQVMPVPVPPERRAQRPAEPLRRLPAPGSDVPPPVAPRPSAPNRLPRGPRFRPFRLLKLLVLAVVLYVVFLVGAGLHALSTADTVAALKKFGRPAEQPGTTYLLVGSDSRKGLTAQQAQSFGGDVGQRTDTIMLLHIGKGPDLLMSIPRDSLVEVPGHGVRKINSAYAEGGAALLVRTIEQNTGIRIDDYIEIGFGGVMSVVDAVGGIEICPTKDMVDPQAALDIKAGCQQADGKTALGYARSRHTSGLGDIDRAKHQREVVSAVGNEVVSPWSLVNPFRYWKLTHAGAAAVTLSDGTGIIDLGRFTLAMISPDLSCGVPISDLAVHWDSERAPKMFNYIKKDKTSEMPKSLCTESGLPKSVTG